MMRMTLKSHSHVDIVRIFSKIKTQQYTQHSLHRTLMVSIVPAKLNGSFLVYIWVPVGGGQGLLTLQSKQEHVLFSVELENARCTCIRLILPRSTDVLSCWECSNVLRKKTSTIRSTSGKSTRVTLAVQTQTQTPKKVPFGRTKKKVQRAAKLNIVHLDGQFLRFTRGLGAPGGGGGRAHKY